MNATAKRGHTGTGSLTAYSHYLVMKAQLAGNMYYDGHAPSGAEREIAEQCRSLCGRIARRLTECRENEIPELLESYDVACRLGNNCAPDVRFIDSYKRRVFDAWKSGHGDVSESQVFGVIAPYVSCRSGKVVKEYVSAYTSIKDRWVATLIRHNRFPDTTAYESYRRLALLTRCDLEGYFNGSSRDAVEAKRRWYAENRVSDLTTIGTLILRAYRSFVSSLNPDVLDFGEMMELDSNILAELATRPDLDPYDREAFRLALEFNRELAAV